MIRILAAAAAAALVAAPAFAQSTRVALDGKSPQQVTADINRAANRVCRLAAMGASFPRELYASCYKHTVADATAKANAIQMATAGGSVNSAANGAETGAN